MVSCELFKWKGGGRGQVLIMVFFLSFMYGKNNLLTASFVDLVYCSCHFVILFSFHSVNIVSVVILS